MPENSRPFSFRLNAKRGRERQALDYLERRFEAGDDVRSVVADALADAAEREQLLIDMAEMQRHALIILRKIESGAIAIQSREAGDGESAVTNEFTASVTELARPLRRLGD
jgi:hypothetical protein